MTICKILGLAYDKKPFNLLSQNKLKTGVKNLVIYRKPGLQFYDDWTS
jgi:hypothetical protein